MKLLIIITTIFYILQLARGNDNWTDDRRYCFQFTLLSGKYGQNLDNRTKNCRISQPCVKPVIATNDSTMPNVTHMWNVDYANDRSQISCPLISEYVCIKYTYIFNNAIENITYFCGKMIEDGTSAINSGCYKQMIGGHTIEACACQSIGGHMPCNTSSGIHYQSFIQMFIIIMTIYWCLLKII